MTIKQLREMTGLSQDKFAQMTHIPAGSIRNWEQGIRKPPEYVLFLLENFIKKGSK